MTGTNLVGEPAELKRFTGPQRAAVVMLVLGPEMGAPIWEELSVDEMKELSAAIAQLGRVPTNVAEHLLVTFSGEMGHMKSLHGSFETTERLLRGVVPEDRLNEIMEDIRGPSGRTMWDKLSNVNEVVLAAYLRSEYPQTVAVIMSKLKPDHCARVLGALPRDFAVDVIQRMLKLDHVQKSVLTEVEQTLRSEFMNNLSRAQTNDPHEQMADVFNAMDRSNEEALLTALEENIPDSAERIRQLMFTFEDLATLLPTALAAIVKNADKRQMALALKGATEEMRELFFGTLTERAAKMLRDDIATMGPVRARDCEEAQSALVALAKTLAERGEIALVDPGSEESMIV
ncbi:flagellar motor switch protein FliG [Pacificimonas flava]|uniref:Flagellar motor switch protein FliG n=2 Tax=Pacificimonas TaxID=1960290 RepID=A0A219B5A9_9SPHN|nr:MULTISPECIES: flagellar motor switch protein FliG [Pacificimonas]MBZ6379209.1 flagellar motor switch protein FliG [Pacificimonas aurantium]OWV33572.1 flagellar motor switch protein FliG [Pacificimonas flava]